MKEIQGPRLWEASWIDLRNLTLPPGHRDLLDSLHRGASLCDLGVSLLWAELCSPPNSYVEVLTSECDCLGERFLTEVRKVQ